MVDEDIQRINDWLRATGMTESRLGLLAAANPRAVKRIREGVATIETLRRVLKFIADNPAPPGARKRR